MLAVLLVLGLFIVLMQLGLMGLLRRLAQQLELERSRVDALERAMRRADVERRLAPGREPAVVAPEAAPPDEPLRSRAPAPAAPAAPVAQGEAAAPTAEPAQLRGEMLGLMRQLVEQGMSVRDIAARCGLSEAEAELMLSLQAGVAHG